MNSKNKIKWENLLRFKNDAERIEHEADMISLRIATELEMLLEEREMSKKEFAKSIGTSASYVTQILRGDKRINMVFLAKVLQKLNVTFDFGFKPISDVEYFVFKEVTNVQLLKEIPKQKRIVDVDNLNKDFYKYAHKAS